MRFRINLGEGQEILLNQEESSETNEEQLSQSQKQEKEVVIDKRNELIIEMEQIELGETNADNSENFTQQQKIKENKSSSSSLVGILFGGEKKQDASSTVTVLPISSPFSFDSPFSNIQTSGDQPG